MGFSYHGPLEAGDPLYQGRQDEANKLLDACQDKVQSYYIVYGSRQSGKTSLLKHLQPRFKSIGWYPCWVDFQRIYGASPEQTMLFLAQQIIQSVPQFKTSTKILNKFKNKGMEFDSWLAELPFENPIVLLIEEIGALPQDSRRRLGGLLRGMFTDRHAKKLEHVMVVFFGGIELFDMSCKEVSPLQNICEKIYLTDLNQNETFSLLKLGFNSKLNMSSFNFRALAEAIHIHVEGHPYLTQRLGDLALAYATAQSALPDARKIVDIAIKLQENDNGQEGYWGYLYKTIIEYSLIDACHRLLSHLPYSVHDEEMMRLYLLGIARKKDDQWVVRNQLLEQGLTAWLPSALADKRDLMPLAKTGVEPETLLVNRRKDLITLLKVMIGLPCLATQTGRRATLIRSGLDDIAPHFDLSGEPVTAIPLLFNDLDRYGKIETGEYALGLFLSELQNQVGLEMKQLIKTFVDKYGLMDSKTVSIGQNPHDPSQVVNGKEPLHETSTIIYQTNQKIIEVQQQWDLLSEKLSRLEKERILVTQSDEKFRLEKLIDDLKVERKQIEQQLAYLENQLSSETGCP